MRSCSSLLLVIAAVACGGGDTDDIATVRDSAGIRIVENRAEPRDLGWQLAATPDLTVGVLEGPPDEQLFRVSGALRLDGRIVVANAGTSELRFFDEGGRFLSAAGREGDGPGEFRGMSRIHRYGPDSLLVYDPSVRRVSVFGTGGVYARSVTLPRISDVQIPQLAGVFGDGTLFIRTGRVFGPGGVEDGLTREPLPLFRLAVDGAVRDTLGEFPGSEAFVQTSGNGFMVTSPAFGRSPSMWAHGEHFFYGASDTYEVSVHAKDGTLERLIRLDRANREVTPALIEEYKRTSLEEIEDENFRRRFESLFEAMSFPATMPAYSSLLVDSEGCLWVQDYHPRGEETNRWTVFDPEGRLLGRVDLPSGFTVYEIGGDYVLGRRMDELDVEHVELYRLAGRPSSVSPQP